MAVPVSQAWTVATYVLKQKLKGRKKYPLVLMLEPLFRCNLACAGCGKIQYPAHILKAELSPEDCFNAVEECGTPMVAIPGGEPLLHPRMPEIVAGLVARRKYVYMCTNALLLKEKLHLFKPSKYLSFSVHVDGQREHHDFSVCREGGYDIAMEGVRAAVAAGFRVTTNTTLFDGADPNSVRAHFDELMTAGVENWLAMPDLPRDLTLTCARGTHTESMPENIIGALFYVAKPYALAVENQKRGQWVQKAAQPLTGKTLGILGLGAIGQEVARIAATLRMRVIGTRRRPEPMAHVDAVLPPERTSEVLAQSDFLLLLLPATPETESFVDAGRLAMMKPGAWLLNFGRGQIIKDDDLIAAVKAKQIAGAVLDVFRQEPLPAEHPFWTTEGIIVLPHIGGPHPQRDRFVARLFVENLGRFLDGKPLKEAVDRKTGY